MATKKPSSPNFKDIIQHLDVLSGHLAKFNSLKYVFLRGIIAGIGTAIGASVIAAIIISILAYVINQAGNVPYLNTVFDNTVVESVLNNGR